MVKLGKIRKGIKSSNKALAHAIERRRHPDRFILIDQTPWESIYSDGIMSVRRYQLPAMDTIEIEGKVVQVENEKKRVPLLLVPALGIHAWTFDIMPTRSMVRYLMARGFDVFLIDWGKPSRSDREITLDTYVNQWFPSAMNAVKRHSGSDKVSIMGYCMGGLLSLMYLGVHGSKDVPNLITIASPVNFHRGGLYGQVFSLMSIPAMKAHDWFQARLEPLDSQMFHVPGRMLSFGFKMTNPPAIVTSYLDLVKNITDREYVTEHMTLGQWFNDMVDYPGGTVREIIEKMVIANRLANGQIEIGGEVSDFSRIDSELLAFAGATDKIVNTPAAKDILRVTGCRSKRFEVIPGGHAGVFAGSRAPEYCWRTSADWLASRSL